MSRIITTTPRLLVREMTPGDEDFLFAVFSDPQVARFLSKAPWTSRVEADAYIRENQLRYEGFGYGRWAVVRKDTGEAIGSCGFRFREQQQCADLGYSFLQSAWGNGFATEAAAACVRAAFEQFGVAKISAAALPENAASLRVLVKSGLKRSGITLKEDPTLIAFEAFHPEKEKARPAPLLETERLRFRETHPGDARTMFALNSDPEVVQYTGDGPFASVEEAHSFLENYVSVYRKFNRGRWLLELKSTGEVIGWCGLKFHEDNGETDVGYRLFKRHWGNGYATEASKAAIDYGFGKLQLNHIVAHARKENIASLRVLEKCGLKIIGQDNDCGGEIFVWEILK